jgi:hypothetical protein
MGDVTVAMVPKCCVVGWPMVVVASMASKSTLREVSGIFELRGRGRSELASTKGWLFEIELWLK